jgi:hypothetical protein
MQAVCENGSSLATLVWLPSSKSIKVASKISAKLTCSETCSQTYDKHINFNEIQLPHYKYET